MPNAFLIIRFVFLSILLYLSLFVLCFAGWNVYAMGAAGLSIPSALYLMLLTTCLTMILSTLSFAELYCGISIFSRVRFESAWTGILALLQLAGIISYAFVEPTAKCNGDWNVCSSASVLLPFTAIAFVMMLTYFAALTATAITHANKSPEVWTLSVYKVDWFAAQTGSLATMNPSKTTYTTPRATSGVRGKDSWSLYIENIANNASRKPVSDVEKQPRRAVDSPFPCISRRIETSSSVDGFRAAPAPTYLRGQASEGSIGSRFIERIRESRYTLRAQGRSSSDSSTPFSTRSSVSTTDIDDSPIPLPRLSTWITAETHRSLTSDA